MRCVLIALFFWNGMFALRADIILPEADTFIQRSSPTTNFGGADELRIKNSPDTNNRKTYLRFNLAGLGFDHTTELASATLRLNFYDGGLGTGGNTNWNFQVYGLNDGNAGETWGENAITWNNAPENDTSSGNLLLGGTTSLGTFSFTGRTADISFSGTAIRDFVAGSTSDDLVTFIVVRDTLQPIGSSNTYVHYVASRTHPTEQGPELELTMIPESSSLLLALMGMVVLFRFRRNAL